MSSINSFNTFIGEVNSAEFDIDQYYKDVKEEFLAKEPPKPFYKIERETKTARIAKEIFLDILSVVFFPYGLYRLLHIVMGKAVVPAQLKRENQEDRKNFHELVKNEYSALKLFREGGEVNSSPSRIIAKRVSIMVDGKLIDAMVLGTAETLKNKKWTLMSNGNGDSYESYMLARFDELSTKVDSLGTNILLYNYQGVGSSEGHATREGIVNAHKAMVAFLENEAKAETIIQHGISLGGGVQGMAMKNHIFKEDVKYVFVKDQSFSKSSRVLGSFIGFFMKTFGWELSSETSSARLDAEGKPEIIIQKAKRADSVKAADIEHDGVISSKASLAYKLLKNREQWKYKSFVGVRNNHCVEYSASVLDSINRKIQMALDSKFPGFYPDAV